MALCLSSIPYTIPVAGVKIGLIDGEFILNPTSEQREKSTLDLTVCATNEKVMMIEAGGNEIPEDTMISAIEFGFNSCKQIIAFQEEAMKKFGKVKEEPVLFKVDKETEKDVKDFASEMVKEAMYIMDKDERNIAMDEVNKKVFAEFEEKYEGKEGDIKEVL